jgi:hypothetical protein
MRRRLGCHGGASDVYYADRQEETDTCPRRHLRSNPDLGVVFDLYHLHGGSPRSGLGVTLDVTEAALEALSVVDEAVSYQREQREAQMRAEAAARSRLPGGANE